MIALTLLEGVRTVQLTQGKAALIDDADHGIVSARTWSTQRVRDTYWYAFTGGGCKPRITLHRFLTDAPKGTHVDHRNGDTLDNRRDNLRVCTPAENIRNIRRTYGGSRYKGVCRHMQCGRLYWRSRIQRTDGTRVELGNFKTQEEAALAYDKAAVEMFGEYACTNTQLFPDLATDRPRASVSEVAGGLAIFSNYGDARVWTMAGAVAVAVEVGRVDAAHRHSLELLGWEPDPVADCWKHPA
jgi:hypothetical protein